MFRNKRILLILLAFLVTPCLVLAAPGSQELLDSANLAEAQGYLDLAIHYTSHALKESPGDRNLRRKLAKLMQKAGHFGLAEEQWKAILAIDPKDAEALAAVAFLNSKAALATGSGAYLTPAAKADFPFGNGTAAWVYGDARAHVGTINQFNATAPLKLRIKYVFPQAGTIGFNSGNASFSWNLDRATILADNLSGDILVFPLIEGSIAGSKSIKDKEWDRIGKSIADQMNAQDRIAGILFQIAPQEPQLHALYAAVKKHTQKPVGAAFRIWDKDVFDYVDFAVLLAWGFSNDSFQYAERARNQVGAFLRDARDKQIKGLIGVPAAATGTEYEASAASPTGTKWTEKRPGPDGKVHTSGMKDFVEAAHAAVHESLVDDDPAYLGLGIYAFRPDGGVLGEKGNYWYFPSTIAPTLLETFKLPIGATRK